MPKLIYENGRDVPIGSLISILEKLNRDLMIRRDREEPFEFENLYGWAPEDVISGAVHVLKKVEDLTK